jgi:hypothetical protein
MKGLSKIAGEKKTTTLGKPGSCVCLEPVQIFTEKSMNCNQKVTKYFCILPIIVKKQFHESYTADQFYCIPSGENLYSRESGNVHSQVKCGLQLGNP